MNPEFSFQRLSAQDPAPWLDGVVRMSMQTVLETIPEFGGDPERARAVLPNFSFTAMRAMFAADLDKASHRIVALLDPDGEVRGYGAFSLKRDESGQTYGYVYSMGLDPGLRRQGLGARLLQEAESWFSSQAAAYVRAETHCANQALQSLLMRRGYSRSEPIQGHWPYIVLSKPLAPDTGLSLF